MSENNCYNKENSIIFNFVICLWASNSYFLLPESFVDKTLEGTSWTSLNVPVRTFINDNEI
jgi:hypothetical protein